MKILQPENLDLHSFIKDEQYYLYLTYTGGKKGFAFKKGNVLRKLIPAIQYFISKIICTDEAQGDYRIIGFKRIRISDVEHAMGYRKMKQVIHFLVQQHIIEVKGITEFITINGKQFGINAKYFRLIPPYDGRTKIQEISLKTKRKVSINDRAKQLVESNPVIRHQYKMCSSYKFNAELAEIKAYELHSKGLKNDKQLVSMLDYIERLRNQSVLFNYNEKTGRIFTIINLCHKELREYFQEKKNDKKEKLVELDFSTFNIQVLHKLIDDSVTINNINEILIEELDTMAQWLDEDFYKQIQEIGVNHGTNMSRDDAKNLALKHWQNARTDSWNDATKIMRTLFPEVSKVMDELKGIDYPDYLNYSNNFMRIESQLAQEIYTEFITKYPQVTIYNIFDSFMVEKRYKDNLKRIMEDCSRNYFKRQVTVKEKVTN